jgi:hypothetical protein
VTSSLNPLIVAGLRAGCFRSTGYL